MATILPWEIITHEKYPGQSTAWRKYSEGTEPRFTAAYCCSSGAIGSGYIQIKPDGDFIKDCVKINSIVNGGWSSALPGTIEEVMAKCDEELRKHGHILL
jgi:hypothetical protein